MPFNQLILQRTLPPEPWITYFYPGRSPKHPVAKRQHTLNHNFLQHYRRRTVSPLSTICALSAVDAARSRVSTYYGLNALEDMEPWPSHALSLSSNAAKFPKDLMIYVSFRTSAVSWLGPPPAWNASHNGKYSSYHPQTLRNWFLTLVKKLIRHQL